MQALPPALYPAFAPLSAPTAAHLVQKEWYRYRRVTPSKRPAIQNIWMTVLQRVEFARSIVFEYMSPFVATDKIRQRKGMSRAFPQPEWLLDALAAYVPGGKRNAEATIDDWQKRGLLWREKTRGMLDLTSVASLLIARVANSRHKTTWLPSFITEDEPVWWCYGKYTPYAPVQAVPIPIPVSQRAATLLWTPWAGAAWDDEWEIMDEKVYRWAGQILAIEELEVWDSELPAIIRQGRSDVLLGRSSVQQFLVQEASDMVLARAVHKGVCKDEPTIW